MTPMLEKAARALWNRRETELPERTRMTWEAGTDLAKSRALADARAVLLAVREIDPDVMLSVQWGRVPERIQTYWEDVLDAILKGSE